MHRKPPIHSPAYYIIVIKFYYNYHYNYSMTLYCLHNYFPDHDHMVRTALGILQTLSTESMKGIQWTAILMIIILLQIKM